MAESMFSYEVGIAQHNKHDLPNNQKWGGVGISRFTQATKHTLRLTTRVCLVRESPPCVVKISLELGLEVGTDTRMAGMSSNRLDRWGRY